MEEVYQASIGSDDDVAMILLVAMRYYSQSGKLSSDVDISETFAVLMLTVQKRLMNRRGRKAMDRAMKKAMNKLREAPDA